MICKTYASTLPIRVDSAIRLNGTAELVTSSTKAIACSDGIAYNCRFQHVVVVVKSRMEKWDLQKLELWDPHGTPNMTSTIDFSRAARHVHRGNLPTWLIV